MSNFYWWSQPTSVLQKSLEFCFISVDIVIIINRYGSLYHNSKLPNFTFLLYFTSIHSTMTFGLVFLLVWHFEVKQSFNCFFNFRTEINLDATKFFLPGWVTIIYCYAARSLYFKFLINAIDFQCFNHIRIHVKFVKKNKIQ